MNVTDIIKKSSRSNIKNWDYVELELTTEVTNEDDIDTINDQIYTLLNGYVTGVEVDWRDDMTIWIWSDDQDYVEGVF
jgi:hypothetical protein